MKFESIEPSARLNNLVRCFYELTIDPRERDNSGLVADDGCYELMFVRESDLTLVDSREKPHLVPGSFTLHHVAPPFRFRIPRTLTCFCIKLNPAANGLFFDESLEEGVIDLNDVFGNQVEGLRKSLFEANTIESKKLYAEDFLQTIELNEDEQFGIIDCAVNAINKSNGVLRVDELANDLRITRQALNRSFTSLVKHSPKTYARFVRIRAAIEYKIANPEVSLTDTALEFGYFDQAHFCERF